MASLRIAITALLKPGGDAAQQCGTSLGQRLTLPAFKQDVHTLMRLGVLPSVTRTDWMFGFQRRFVRR